MAYLEERVEELEKKVEELEQKKKEEQYKTPKELAAYMGCSSAHISNLIKRKQIEAITLGSLVRIPMSQFELHKEDKKEVSMRERVFGKMSS